MSLSAFLDARQRHFNLRGARDRVHHRGRADRSRRAALVQVSPRPKLTHFGRENAEGIRLALAKKAAEKTAPANRSGWIGTARAEFRAEVQRSRR